MDKAGFDGMVRVLEGEENAEMIKDQLSVVTSVRGQLEVQKANPHKEIIVVSGGPGTGKTIIGMHFIYDYADIFNNKDNAYGSVFCLPKSKTVKAMIDHECGKKVVPYLDKIDNDQKLVVVDEAHRITGLEDTLNSVFAKGTKLLILLQDDHQRIRPGEDGTVEKIHQYAKDHKIEYTPLKLTIQKRCEALGKLLDGLEKMFYTGGFFPKDTITSVRVFERLQCMDLWINHMAETSRAKFIAPFCWEWRRGIDVQIDDNGFAFRKAWNPKGDKKQVRWHYGLNRAGEVASIYTCQGLDQDDVAFIWWDDLVWDDVHKQWKADINKSKDNVFVQGVREAKLSDKEITDLFINTYYVMLSRARNKMGIWFKDEATKKRVVGILDLKMYSKDDVVFNKPDSVNTIKEIPEEKKETMVIGNSLQNSYHRPKCKYAPRKSEKRVEFESIDMARKAGFKPCPACNPDEA